MGITVEPKAQLALACECFLWKLPYMKGSQGVFDGVQRGPALGPPELAALSSARVNSGTGSGGRSNHRSSLNAPRDNSGTVTLENTAIETG